MKWLKRFLYSEIGIEFKACLYFCVILFFYFVYQILQGSLTASIIIMTEMIFTAYFIGYIQVYLLHNFDELEHFGKKEGAFAVICSVVYTLASYLLNWYDKNWLATVLFFCYLLLVYLCVFLIYKIKRDADTIRLNRELEQFKNQKGEE